MEEIRRKILWKNKRTKVPGVLQIEQTECGAASLAMILEYHKCFIPIEQLRCDCGMSRDGSNAFNLVKAARKYGFNTKGFSIGTKDLNTIEIPALLHWNFNHFLVLEGRKGNTFYLNDPAEGEKTISLEEFEHYFSGLAIQIIPDTNFKPAQTPKSVFRTLTEYFMKSRPVLLYILVCTILLAIPGIAIPSFSMVFVDHILGGRTELLLPLLVALSLFLLMKAYVSWLQRTVILKISSKFLITNAASLFEHILRLPAEFYHLRSPGDLQYRLTLNRNISNFISGPAGEAFSNLIAASFFLVIMFQYDIPLAAAGVFIVVLNLSVIHILNIRKQSLNQVLAHEKNKISSLITHGIRSAETIKASASDFEFFSKWAGLQAKKNNTEQKIISSNIYAGAIPEMLLGINITAILTFGAWRVINGDMSIGMLVAFQALMGAFLAPAANLVTLLPNIQRVKEDFRKINDILKHKKDPIFEESNTKSENLSGEKLFLSGELELRNIVYGYSTSSDALIKDFSLHLKPGKKIGITGRSGAGKSTIAKLAAGLYNPWKGEVLLDGKPILSYSRECIENSLSIVEQNPVMFCGSIHENLSMWNPLKDEKELMQAAVNADIHSIIMNRSGGYNSDIKENAQNFSGGEKQRLDIARALVNNPSLLILDEATSALDDETIKIIFENIRKCGCAVLIISQQDEILKDCDEVIILDEGKIVYKGSYKSIDDYKNADITKFSGYENEP